MNQPRSGLDKLFEFLFVLGGLVLFLSFAAVCAAGAYSVWRQVLLP